MFSFVTVDTKLKESENYLVIKCITRKIDKLDMVSVLFISLFLFMAKF